ncbi:MAG: hypothetical protein IK123_06515, partial [Lachnospiraceae bacterium]|nr:hypothetical protein [Lachnospiraceae bacterium]
HFNEYEHCRFDTDNTVYSPDLFRPFRNTTAMDYPSVLNVEEREYLAYIFELRYTMRTSYEESYRHRYKPLMDYKMAVEKLAPVATDLNRLSECVGEMRKNGRVDP